VADAGGRSRDDDPISTRPEPYSPYCGLIVNEDEQYEKVQCATLVAISAPTRTGKTRRLLAPAAVGSGRNRASVSATAARHPRTTVT